MNLKSKRQHLVSVQALVVPLGHIYTTLMKLCVGSAELSLTTCVLFTAFNCVGQRTFWLPWHLNLSYPIELGHNKEQDGL